MNIHQNSVPISANHLLTCLDLAIEEARLAKSLIEPIKHDNIYTIRLEKLNREIDYLEAKRLQVRATDRA